MPKLITVHHSDQIAQQARDYVRSYILLPSSLMGFLCLVGGVGGLGYQLIASDSYTWSTFYFSSGLIALGVIIGTAQTRYHRYLLKEFPDVFAARMKRAPGRQSGKVKKEAEPPAIDHSGRQLIPVAYLVGVSALVGSAVAAILYGQVDALPALLMPWAGFYWGKLFFWRSVIK